MRYARQFRRRHTPKFPWYLVIKGGEIYDMRPGPPRPLRRQIYLVQCEMPQRRWRYWGWVDAV